MRSADGLKPGPSLPSELLAELLPLVGEIHAVLDPDDLRAAIAKQLRHIVDYRIDAAYHEAARDLATGDVFVFHTDGLTEARKGTEAYGTTRLMAQVEAHAALSAPRLGEEITEDLELFLGEASPADDVTLIVVKVL